MDTNAQNGQGRKRNTANNLSTKQQQNFQGVLQASMSQITGGNLPALDPAAVANYYSQLQTLQSQLTNTLAGLKAERKGYRGEAMSQKADVRAEGRTAVVEGINASLERGMLGSSADTEQRINSIATMKSGVTDVNRQLYDALAQNRMQVTGAALSAEQGVQALTGTAISQRMDLQAQELQNALAIQTAQMQAQASQIQSNATIYAAQQGLRSARITAQGIKAAALNFDPRDWYRQRGLPVPDYLKPNKSTGSGELNFNGDAQSGAVGLGR